MAMRIRSLSLRTESLGSPKGWARSSSSLALPPWATRWLPGPSGRRRRRCEPRQGCLTSPETRRLVSREANGG